MASALHAFLQVPGTTPLMSTVVTGLSAVIPGDKNDQFTLKRQVTSASESSPFKIWFAAKLPGKFKYVYSGKYGKRYEKEIWALPCEFTRVQVEKCTRNRQGMEEILKIQKVVEGHPVPPYSDPVDGDRCGFGFDMSLFGGCNLSPKTKLDILPTGPNAVPVRFYKDTVFTTVGNPHYTAPGPQTYHLEFAQPRAPGVYRYDAILTAKNREVARICFEVRVPDGRPPMPSFTNTTAAEPTFGGSECLSFIIGGSTECANATIKVFSENCAVPRLPLPSPQHNGTTPPLEQFVFAFSGNEQEYRLKPGRKTWPEIAWGYRYRVCLSKAFCVDETLGYLEGQVCPNDATDRVTPTPLEDTSPRQFTNSSNVEVDSSQSSAPFEGLTWTHFGQGEDNLQAATLTVAAQAYDPPQAAPQALLEFDPDMYTAPLGPSPPAPLIMPAALHFRHPSLATRVTLTGQLTQPGTACDGNADCSQQFDFVYDVCPLDPEAAGAAVNLPLASVCADSDDYATIGFTYPGFRAQAPPSGGVAETELIFSLASPDASQGSSRPALPPVEETPTGVSEWQMVLKAAGSPSMWTEPSMEQPLRKEIVVTLQTLTCPTQELVVPFYVCPPKNAVGNLVSADIEVGPDAASHPAAEFLGVTYPGFDQETVVTYGELKASSPGGLALTPGGLALTPAEGSAGANFNTGVDFVIESSPTWPNCAATYCLPVKLSREFATGASPSLGQCETEFSLVWGTCPSGQVLCTDLGTVQTGQSPVQVPCEASPCSCSALLVPGYKDATATVVGLRRSPSPAEGDYALLSVDVTFSGTDFDSGVQVSIAPQNGLDWPDTVATYFLDVLLSQERNSFGVSPGLPPCQRVITLTWTVCPSGTVSGNDLSDAEIGQSPVQAAISGSSGLRVVGFTSVSSITPTVVVAEVDLPNASPAPAVSPSDFVVTFSDTDLDAGGIECQVVPANGQDWPGTGDYRMTVEIEQSRCTQLFQLFFTVCAAPRVAPAGNPAIALNVDLDSTNPAVFVDGLNWPGFTDAAVSVVSSSIPLNVSPLVYTGGAVGLEMLPRASPAQWPAVPTVVTGVLSLLQVLPSGSVCEGRFNFRFNVCPESNDPDAGRPAGTSSPTAKIGSSNPVMAQVMYPGFTNAAVLTFSDPGGSTGISQPDFNSISVLSVTTTTPNVVWMLSIPVASEWNEPTQNIYIKRVQVHFAEGSPACERSVVIDFFLCPSDISSPINAGTVVSASMDSVQSPFVTISGFTSASVTYGTLSSTASLPTSVSFIPSNEATAIDFASGQTISVTPTNGSWDAGEATYTLPVTVTQTVPNSGFPSAECVQEFHVVWNSVADVAFSWNPSDGTGTSAATSIVRNDSFFWVTFEIAGGAQLTPNGRPIAPRVRVILPTSDPLNEEGVNFLGNAFYYAVMTAQLTTPPYLSDGSSNILQLRTRLDMNAPAKYPALRLQSGEYWFMLKNNMLFATSGIISLGNPENQMPLDLSLSSLPPTPLVFTFTTSLPYSTAGPFMSVNTLYVTWRIPYGQEQEVLKIMYVRGRTTQVKQDTTIVFTGIPIAVQLSQAHIAIQSLVVTMAVLNNGSYTFLGMPGTGSADFQFTVNV